MQLTKLEVNFDLEQKAIKLTFDNFLLNTSTGTQKCASILLTIDTVHYNEELGQGWDMHLEVGEGVAIQALYGEEMILDTVKGLFKNLFKIDLELDFTESGMQGETFLSLETDLEDDDKLFSRAHTQLLKSLA